MKKQKILMAVASLGFALVALPVFADETIVPGAVEGANKVLPIRTLERKDNIKDVLKARQNAEQERKDKRIEVKAISSLKETEDRREEFKKQFEGKREEAKKKVEAEKVRLDEKLKTIKDEKKKNIVQNINKQLQELNAKKLEHFSNVLAQMEKVLVKVKARAEKAQAGGADMSAINAKIVAFEGAVTTARAAIVAQSTKVYSIEITTEEHLKNNTGATRQALQKDLKAVFGLVKKAHEALKGITKELAKVRIADKDDDDHQTATTTATTTTTTTTPTTTATTTDSTNTTTTATTTTNQ